MGIFSKSAAAAGLPKRKLLTPEQMRERGFSIPWLNRARCTGEGPPFVKLNPEVINSPVLYDEADVDHWLEERKLTSTSQASFPPRTHSRKAKTTPGGDDPHRAA